MSWRTIYVDNANKLTLSLDNLIVINNNEKYSISLTEIESIVVSDYKSVITTRLLARCCEVGINVVFTKQNMMPVGALHSLENNSRASKLFKKQLQMTNNLRQVIWKQIIESKILNQAAVLAINHKGNDILLGYAKEVEAGDLSNKEGQAARVYFKELFGDYFKRGDSEITNYSLNYTYQVLRSKIAQIIIAKGLNPSLGIYHRNEYNYFNLADDVIEVFRPHADNYVLYILKDYHYEYLTPELKVKLVNVINSLVMVNGKCEKISNAIMLYIEDLLKLINMRKECLTQVPLVYEE